MKMYEKIEKLLKEKGISRKELSKRTKIPLGTIGRYLTEDDIPIKNMEKIAEVLETTTDYLRGKIETEHIENYDIGKEIPLPDKSINTLKKLSSKKKQEFHKSQLIPLQKTNLNYINEKIDAINEKDIIANMLENEYFFSEILEPIKKLMKIKVDFKIKTENQSFTHQQEKEVEHLMLDITFIFKRNIQDYIEESLETFFEEDEKVRKKGNKKFK